MICARACRARSFPGEHLHVNHRSGDSGGTRSSCPSRSEAFSPKNRAKPFFLGRKRVLPWASPAHQNVARLDFRRCIRYRTRQASRAAPRPVRNVARDLLGPSLVSRATTVRLLDVDRGIAVIRHDALGNQDRISKLKTFPGLRRPDVLPSAELPMSVEAPSATTSPLAIARRFHQSVY